MRGPATAGVGRLLKESSKLAAASKSALVADCHWINNHGRETDARFVKAGSNS